jgi:hypothetical protein
MRPSSGTTKNVRLAGLTEQRQRIQPGGDARFSTDKPALLLFLLDLLLFLFDCQIVGH